MYPAHLVADSPTPWIFRTSEMTAVTSTLAAVTSSFPLTVASVFAFSIRPSSCRRHDSRRALWTCRELFTLRCSRHERLSSLLTERLVYILFYPGKYLEFLIHIPFFFFSEIKIVLHLIPNGIFFAFSFFFQRFYTALQRRYKMERNMFGELLFHLVQRKTWEISRKNSAGFSKTELASALLGAVADARGGGL